MERDRRIDAEELMTDESFVPRHLGPDSQQRREMLKLLGFETMEALIDKVLPSTIRQQRPLQLGPGHGEARALAQLDRIASLNQVFRSYIGMGYYDCITPPVIQRNILENPGWYTHYTPYQPEIAQGRLEALLNFQTMVSDLTALEIANASLLDEATAAAEAMHMSYAAAQIDSNVFFVSDACLPQTIEVVRTRARATDIEIIVGDHRTFDPSRAVFGALLQYPAQDGAVFDYSEFVRRVHDSGGLVSVAADLLSLALLRPPGEFGADVAVGTTQRFGVPLGYGGPHAAYFATREAYKRLTPGRIVGVSRDASGRAAFRLALQTREQHIRREKATSNICTAQVLLAVMAGMYAVYHGPDGLRRIAARIHSLAAALAGALQESGYAVGPEVYFDTIRVRGGPRPTSEIVADAQSRGINLRVFENGDLGISLDETTTLADARDIAAAFSGGTPVAPLRLQESGSIIDGRFQRSSDFLTHPIFNGFHSETEMLRYMHRLQAKDLSLTTSMIPLGSCTMKLNAAAEMAPISWPELSRIHPFAPLEQSRGYQQIFSDLERGLAEITGFDAVSLQPNAGSQGELSGLLIIRKYHERRGEAGRRTCLIPQSAHGTNPASAVMAGMKVVVVACDADGNIDVDDLKRKARDNAERLAALMVTYPSTHGVFEERIREICDAIHEYGGQVYMDGANLNAQVGLCRPAEIGADVCHLNLHKTFCIPHGGGGPGMGPIAVKAHLAPFLPGHPVVKTGGVDAIGPVSAAAWGSPGILPISWMYIHMMGEAGLKQATEVAILNANYIARRLDPHYPVLYKGKNGMVAHECIVDLRNLKRTAGIEVEDVAKRLMDYGFHAPTVSFPVPGTMMIEPTESESKQELDRFCEAMMAIRREIREIEAGTADPKDNLLKNAPHTAEHVSADEWKHPYPRERAAYPASWSREHKFWPSVRRVDNVYGDRNLICTCPPIEAYEGEA
jgi:glycine dehydrogenase